jgi:hypothetical protein
LGMILHETNISQYDLIGKMAGESAFRPGGQSTGTGHCDPWCGRIGAAAFIVY